MSTPDTSRKYHLDRLYRTKNVFHDLYDRLIVVGCILIIIPIMLYGMTEATILRLLFKKEKKGCEV
jgi:hypothetical protein